MSTKQQGHYVIRQSKNKEFFWQYWKNWREIARSSETYKRRSGVRKSIAAIQNWGGEIHDKSIPSTSKLKK